MTHVIIALDDSTFIHKDYSKTAEELIREVELGVFQSPAALKNPTAVRLQNYLLIAEREKPPLLTAQQMNVLELLSMGASETEIARAMQLSYSGVRHHVDSLKKKFSVSTREELISIFCRAYRQ